MVNYDVCVVGGGPAGSTIAKKLSDFGYSVILIEKENTPLPNIGLTLSPGVKHWLKLLDIEESVENAGFDKAEVSWLCWESEQVQVKNNQVPGYHVNRTILNTILLNNAALAGAKILRPCTLCDIKQDSEGTWNILLKHDGAPLRIYSQFLVEATGRKAVLKGSRQSYLPATTSVYAFWKETPLKKNISFIEAGDNHFYWGANMPTCGYMICIFSDPMEIRKYQSPKAFYLDKIQYSSLLPYIIEKNANIVDQVSVCTATAFYDKEPISANYIKIGDAAFSLDPLSSQGVQKAMKTGFQGAIVINTLLKKKQNGHMAIDYYKSMIKREIKRNTNWTQQLYNDQNRYRGGEFWQLRKNPLIENYEKEQENKIAIQPNDILIINPDARIVDVPILGEYLIEHQPGITFNDNEEPFVFLQSVPIVPLIRNICNNTLSESLHIIHLSFPKSKPLDVIQWLIFNKIICIQ